MKLIIVNGSPRGRKSNTKLLMDEFIKGMYHSGEENVDMFYLAVKSDMEEAVKAYAQTENVLLAMPLYTDSMPGIVKEFIERLDIYSGKENNPKMGYMIQSGFPEPAHSRFLEEYLEKLTKRMNSEYLGCIVKGGVEGIQIMPSSMTKKLFVRFYFLGKHFAKTTELDAKIIRQMAPREHMSKLRLFFFKMMSKTRMPNYYWDKQLKAHKVYDIRFDRPFA